MSPWGYSDAVWTQVVDCVKATYAPFGVQIVTSRPTSGNYHMAIVAGTPQNVQMQQGVGGVSPYTCGYIPNAISFSFAGVYGPTVDDICWTVAQETALESDWFARRRIEQYDAAQFRHLAVPAADGEFDEEKRRAVVAQRLQEARE